MSVLYPSAVPPYVAWPVPTIIDRTVPRYPFPTFPVTPAATVIPAVVPGIAPTPALVATPAGFSVAFPNINADGDLQDQVTAYFWDKLTEEWLKYDPRFVEIYKLIKIDGGSPRLVSTSAEHAANSGAYDPAKAAFITSTVFRQHSLRKALARFAAKNGINWWDIKRNAEYVPRFVAKYLKNKIMKKALLPRSA